MYEVRSEGSEQRLLPSTCRETTCNVHVEAPSSPRPLATLAHLPLAQDQPTPPLPYSTTTTTTTITHTHTSSQPNPTQPNHQPGIARSAMSFVVEYRRVTM